jgi:hypothetical protein
MLASTLLLKVCVELRLKATTMPAIRRLPSPYRLGKTLSAASVETRDAAAGLAYWRRLVSIP